MLSSFPIISSLSLSWYTINVFYCFFFILINSIFCISFFASSSIAFAITFLALFLDSTYTALPFSFISLFHFLYFYFSLSESFHNIILSSTSFFSAITLGYFTYFFYNIRDFSIYLILFQVFSRFFYLISQCFLNACFFEPLCLDSTYFHKCFLNKAFNTVKLC